MLKEDEKMQFGLKIQDMREKAGLTQAEAEELLDIPPKTLSRYESGASTPNAILYDKMIKIFSRPQNDFLQQFGCLSGANQAMIISLMGTMLTAQGVKDLKM